MMRAVSLSREHPIAKAVPGGGVPVVAAAGALVAFTCTVIYFATSPGSYPWPLWVWLATFLPPLAVRYASRPPGRKRVLATQLDIGAFVLASTVLAWALDGGGYFWPSWVALGLGVAFLSVKLWRWQKRSAAARERVSTLERTRSGALDAQDVELRRIERDLHDGAQARLVALSMMLGRTEGRLTDRPEEAELIRAAREQATAAISELRDLARGIAPPVLSDRGLMPAIDALAQRSGVPVALTGELPERPRAAIESAAYFVTAEALTNIAKHAPGAAAGVHLAASGDTLVVTVSDDGPGGADATGTGLVGLRKRAEALDGTLTVRSEPGATSIQAVLPCAW